MSVRLDIKVFGERQYAHTVRTRAENANHAKPAFDAIGWELVRIQREQFTTEGARSGHPWEQLADSTIELKGNDAILVDEGLLEDSWIPGDPQNIFDATDEGLDFGSRSEYGTFHQTGTTHMPQRKVMDLTDDDKRDLIRILRFWVRTGRVPF